MNSNRQQQIDDAFFALSHPVRRKILERISGADMSVAEVSAPLNETPSQMTKHIHILERAGMLSRHKIGRTHLLHIEPRPLQEIMDWVSRYQVFWNNNIDGLEDYLRSFSEDT